MISTYWNCADGRKVLVKDMSDLHVFNSLQMLFRRLDLPLTEMPESVFEARVYLTNYIKNKEKAKKPSRASYIPRYFGQGDYEPFDEHEGCWEHCH
ncbi:MAG: hypothetical protein ACRC6V_07860 [Bacteroidales bacterium]